MTPVACHVTENILSMFLAEEFVHVAPAGRVSDPELFAAALHSVIDRHCQAPQFSPWYRNPLLSRLTKRDGENVSGDHAIIQVSNAVIGEVSAESVLLAVRLAVSESPDARAVLDWVLTRMRASMEIADLTSLGKATDFGSPRSRWQDTFTRMVTDPEYHAAVEAFTVGDTILVDLIDALFTEPT
jgi:hypothetical protein